MKYSQKAIERIIQNVSKKKITSRSAFQKLRNLSYESLRFAHLDHHRLMRKGLPEVIYAPGKTQKQLEKIALAFFKKQNSFLITRLEKKGFKTLKQKFPKLSYSSEGQIAFVKNGRVFNSTKTVSIVTAGTSDIPVAEEARLTLAMLGVKVNTFYDLGVAGLHRLLDCVPEIEKAKVIICIAGMEGALPSVLAGLVSKPVIAVPTSVGYGANFKGIAPLLAMLNSCAQGVACVNIDSGFNAACFAFLILNS